MVDNVTLASLTASGATIAADDIGGVHHQRVKVQFGADGSATDVSPANPLPVKVESSSATSTVLVSSLPTVSLSDSYSVFISNTINVNPVAISGTATVLVSTIPAVSLTGSALAHLASVAGTVSGSELQVDVITLPTVSLSDSYSVFVSNIPAVSLTGSYLDNSNNALRVNVVAGSTSGTEHNEDAAHTTGDAGIEVLAVRRDTAAVGSGTDGDYSTFNVDSTGRLWTHGLVSLTGSVQVSGITNALPGGDNNIGNVDIVTIPAVSLTGSVVTNLGTIAGAVSGSEMQVDVVAALPAGTNNIGSVSLTGSVSAVVQGAAAHDAAVSGNPVLVGLEARTSNPTAVANGDAVRAMADDMGRQVIMPFAPRDLVVDGHVSLSVSTTQTVLGVGGAGVFQDLTMLTISNPSATAATVTVFDNTVQKFKWELAADGGGVALSFAVPFKQATANDYWAVTSTETGVTVTMQAIQTL